MTVLTWAAVGALLAWLAIAVTHTSDRRGRILNFVIGTAGAILGGALIGSAGDVWAMNLDAFSASSIIAAWSSATILLLVARLARVTG